jgi:hypothetical protein
VRSHAERGNEIQAAGGELRQEGRGVGEDFGLQAELPPGFHIFGDVIGVEAVSGFTADRPQGGLKDGRLRFERTDLVRQHEIIEAGQHVKVPLDELEVGNARVRQQHEPMAARLQFVKHRHQRGVQLENVVAGVQQ